jgi:hypothetical protein
MSEAGDCDFGSSQALLEYATHRLLWSWYSRDRDAQSGSSGPDRTPDHEPESGDGSETDDEFDTTPE